VQAGKTEYEAVFIMLWKYRGVGRDTEYEATSPPTPRYFHNIRLEWKGLKKAELARSFHSISLGSFFLIQPIHKSQLQQLTN
jgi:hypothetical protein